MKISNLPDNLRHDDRSLIELARCLLRVGLLHEAGRDSPHPEGPRILWLPEGSRVADIGCGAGETLEHLEGAAIYRPVGLDYSEALLEEAIPRLGSSRSFGAGRKPFLLGTLFSMPSSASACFRSSKTIRRRSGNAHGSCAKEGFSY